jgi:hypothetical protein
MEGVMKVSLAKTLLATGIMASLAISAGNSYAGGGHHGGYHYGGYHYGGHHYSHGHHNKHHHGKRHYNRHHYKKRGRHGNAELAAGILFGSLLGYAISQHDYTPPRKTVVVTPPRRYVAPEGYAAYGTTTCLQEREYQTSVFVGGRRVEAYGRACLQADGSWRRGPAITAPQY